MSEQPREDEPLVLFVGSIGMTPPDWQRQITALPPERAAFCPPLKTMSRSLEGFSIRGAADELMSIIELRGARRVDLVGLALGGMVCLQIAVDHPELVERMVVSGVQAFPGKEMAKAQRLMMKLMPAKAFEAKGMSKDQAMAVLDGMVDADFSDRLGEIRAETLVLAGADDPQSLGVLEQITAKIPGARSEVVPEAGMALTRENPEAYNRAVFDFLAR